MDCWHRFYLKILEGYTIMSWLSNVFKRVTNPLNRVIHIPDADLLGVSTAAGVTPLQWRNVETEQQQYFATKVVLQFLPHPAQITEIPPANDVPKPP